MASRMASSGAGMGRAGRPLGYPQQQVLRTRRTVCRAEAGDSRPRAKGVTYSNTGVTPTPDFPLTVPFLPFTVEEVLTPGAVKTLHLYEAKYLALLEEVLASDTKLFAHVVVELSQRPRGTSAATFPGAFVGENFVLLMATVVKVLDVRAVDVGAMVRVQAEARARVTGVTQAAPFIRGRLEPLGDAPLEPGEVEEARRLMAELLGVMRDVQNLSLKFKARATSQLQQAMYWWEKPPIISGIRAPPAPPAAGSGAAAAAAGSGSSSRSSTLDASPQPQEPLLDDAAHSSSSAGSGGTPLDNAATTTTSSSSSSSSSSPGGSPPASCSGSCEDEGEVEGRSLRLPGYRREVQASSTAAAEAAASSDAFDPASSSGGASSSSSASSSSEVELPAEDAGGMSGTEELSPGSSLDELTGAPSSSGSVSGDEDPGPLSIALLSERACRLSFAALQHVPGSSEKEQLQLVRQRLKAMETSSSLVRLRLALDSMTATRSLLAAKVALKALNIG